MALSDTLFGAAKNIYSAGVSAAKASYKAGLTVASKSLNAYPKVLAALSGSIEGAALVVGLTIVTFPVSVAVWAAPAAAAAASVALGAAGAAVCVGSCAIASGVAKVAGAVAKRREMVANDVSKTSSSANISDNRSRSSSADSQPVVLQENPMRGEGQPETRVAETERGKALRETVSASPKNPIPPSKPRSKVSEILKPKPPSRGR